MVNNIVGFMGNEEWPAGGVFCAGGGKHPAYKI